MSRVKQYPYVQGKVMVNNIVCAQCNTRVKEGYKVEWRVDIFQGNCEFEKLCYDCYGMEVRKIKEQLHKEAVAYLKREQKRQAKKDNLLAELRAAYDVQVFTPYQWRINGAIDLFPTSKKYHDIRKNKRGFYNDVVKFLEKSL